MLQIRRMFVNLDGLCGLWKKVTTPSATAADIIIACDGYEEGRSRGGGLVLLPLLIEHLLPQLHHNMSCKQTLLLAF
jgi:hypothetical protein